ncbi:MAG: Na+/H+ antiporter NhaC [Tannerella sp.]|jgi:NhaC family Na+:H+ antiporter|nr:Na+/H+ antiporter NhaC [Tannerella sp.]
MKNDHQKKPSPWVSLIPIMVLLIMLYVAIRIFGGNTLQGASQMCLLISTAVCAIIATLCYRVLWKRIEESIINNMKNVALALLILLLIGALSGTWMISGVIPTLIYYGMMIISPDFYLATTCIICAAVSVLTGSSWTTVATVGIALAGIGLAHGFSPGWIGGAIISGAYFGDKISPLSDTTVLASSITDTPVFVHIRYLMITTIPSMTITLLIFIVAGFTFDITSSGGDINAYTDTLDKTFNITPWVLFVPAVMALLIYRKAPSILTLFVSGIIAGIFALIFQPHILQQIAGQDLSGNWALAKGFMRSFFGSTQLDTGMEELNNLVATRGMAGMLNTIWLIICAMCFGGAMAASGMLASIISVCLHFMKHTVGTVATTIFSGLLFNICAGDQYLAVILTGDMFKDVYREKGYDTRLLSRTCEDGATVTSPLVPWNTCGMTQATVLGIPTLVYLPYSFFNLISPIMSIIVAATGYKIKRIMKS